MMISRLSKLREGVARSGGTALVIVLLGGLGLWGHHTGWKLPKRSELRGDSAMAIEDWCEAHNVPDSKCLACHPELGGDDPRDWCKEHGVPESKCTVCHPEILTKGAAADWCREHGVPESQCTVCHPEIAVKGAPQPPKSDVTITAEPPDPSAKDPAACQTHAVRVQFASAQAIEKAGIRLEVVQERPMSASVAAAGEIDYDLTRMARLSSRAMGTVARVMKDFGDPVKRGDVLALVDAADVGRAKAELLQTLVLRDTNTLLLERSRSLAVEAQRLTDLRLAAVERLRSSLQQGFRSQAELQDAEALLQEARVATAKAQAETEQVQATLAETGIRLFNAHQVLLNLGLSLRLEDLAGLAPDALAERVRVLGLPDEITRAKDALAVSANLLPITAALDGIVVLRDTTQGELVDPSKVLFVVADVSRLWIALDVRQEDAGSIAVGQPVIFRPGGGSDDAVQGKLSWISTAVDERTRTVRARAEVENPDRRLRARVFGTGRIITRESPTAVAVPTEAIHWEGCCHVVFVRLSDEVFQTRKVKLGSKTGSITEILVGVLPGEVIATSGSHVLKSELLKSRLGAGCVDD